MTDSHEWKRFRTTHTYITIIIWKHLINVQNIILPYHNMCSMTINNARSKDWDVSFPEISHIHLRTELIPLHRNRLQVICDVVLATCGSLQVRWRSRLVLYTWYEIRRKSTRESRIFRVHFLWSAPSRVSNKIHIWSIQRDTTSIAGPSSIAHVHVTIVESSSLGMDAHNAWFNIYIHYNIQEYQMLYSTSLPTMLPTLYSVCFDHVAPNPHPSKACIAHTRIKIMANTQ